MKTIHEVGLMLGLQLPQPGQGMRSRCKCPFNKHKREEKSFVVFMSKQGEEIWKCFSCDAPDNVGDAVKLYATIKGISRREAWRDMGMPHMAPKNREAPLDQLGSFISSKNGERISLGHIPICGAEHRKVLRLPLEQWNVWAAQDRRAVEELSHSRHLSIFSLMDAEVIAMSPTSVGFTYFHPETKDPCRVKVRCLDRKAFWVEPKPTGPQVGKAMAPLYGAHELKPTEPTIIVEGEIDALSLRSVGIGNVVSLPDGAESSKTVNLYPLAESKVWVVATDDDAPGNDAYEILRLRSKLLHGIRVVRCKWVNGELIYKDANEALCAGYTHDSFLNNIQLSMGVWNPPKAELLYS